MLGPILCDRRNTEVSCWTRHQRSSLKVRILLRRPNLNTKKLNSLVYGRSVARVADAPDGAFEIHFADGSLLIVGGCEEGVSITFQDVHPPAGEGNRSNRPTRRQSEYLEFIRKYMARYGVAPAESDIQRHFMVSAPSAHLMVKTLERRGFITRSRDLYGQAIPRSIRILVDEF